MRKTTAQASPVGHAVIAKEEVDSVTQMQERASDDCREYAEDYPPASTEAVQSLGVFLKGWARKHCTPTTFWKVQNVRQHILTVGDLEKS